ncbi:MAG: cupredoxin domain-containing protein [Thermaerobacterales bacterium]
MREERRWLHWTLVAFGLVLVLGLVRVGTSAWAAPGWYGMGSNMGGMMGMMGGTGAVDGEYPFDIDAHREMHGSMGAGMHAEMHGRMHGAGFGLQGDDQIPEIADTNGVRQEITMSIGEWEITPATIEVKAGSLLAVTVTNDGALPHSFAVPGLDLRLAPLPPGTSRTFEIIVNEPGEFDFFCDIPGHRQAGQSGQLIVTP